MSNSRLKFLLRRAKPGSANAVALEREQERRKKGRGSRKGAQRLGKSPDLAYEKLIVRPSPTGPPQENREKSNGLGTDDSGPQGRALDPEPVASSAAPHARRDYEPKLERKAGFLREVTKKIWVDLTAKVVVGIILAILGAFGLTKWLAGRSPSISQQDANSVESNSGQPQGGTRKKVAFEKKQVDFVANTELTAAEIIRQIARAAPGRKGDVASSFVGLRVRWRLQLSSLDSLPPNGWFVGLVSDDREAIVVAITDQLPPIARDQPSGTHFTIEGTVLTATWSTVTLKPSELVAIEIQ